MNSLGVRELKAHLSEHLRRVQAGERLTITDRGRPVAEIVPVARDPRFDWIYKMIREGHASWGGGKPTGLRKRIPTRGVPASQMVIEDRR